MNKSFLFARFGIRRGSLHSIGAVQAGAGGFWILFLLLWRATGADTSAKALSLLVGLLLLLPVALFLRFELTKWVSLLVGVAFGFDFCIGLLLLLRLKLVLGLLVPVKL